MKVMEIKVKNLSPKEYLDIIRIYLSDNKTQSEWKI